MAKKVANPEGRMSLGAHLVELRNRFLKAAVVILLGAIGGWFLYEPVFQALQEPIKAASTDKILAELNFQQFGSPFDMKVRVSMWLGVLMTSPVWLYQLWAFVTPGLTRKERLYSLAFVGAAVPLFSAGVAMGWVAMPATAKLLIQFTPDGAKNLMAASEYLRFVMIFILIFGLAFLLPLFMVSLNLAGLVSGKTWLKHWRWAVILIFILTALATPGGEITVFLLMGAPIVVLYLLAVGISMLNDRRRAKKLNGSQPPGAGDSVAQAQ